MAGYFITKNKEKFKKIESTVSQEFSKYITLKNIGKEQWQLYFFQKMNVEDHNFFKKGDNFIIGVGAYIYKNKIGGEALESIYNDLQNESLIFKKIAGHFNFITFINNELKIVTDKSGHYFSYKILEDNEISYTTSLTLGASYISQKKYNEQEMLEFVNVASTFGGNTIFKNIVHNKAGNIINLQNNTRDNYFNIHIKNTNFKDFIISVKNYFNNFSNVTKSIGADLSGGFDTRTIAAALLNAKVDFDFLTNNRPESVSKDKEVAIQIAKEVGKQIHVIPLEKNFKNQYIDQNTIIKKLEAARGADILKRVYNEIQNKSNLTDVIIGGWGAEMLRNQHGRFNNLQDLVRGFGYYRININKERDTKYLHAIETKLNYLKTIPKDSNTSISELAFYLEKGKYWSGSVLSARNKYAFWFFPYFDPILSIPMLGLNRKGNKLQNKVVNKLYSNFSKIPYGNIDTESTLVSAIKTFIKKILKLKKYTKQNKFDYPKDVSSVDYKELEELININQDILIQKGASRSVSKYETLGEFIK